MDSMKLFTSIPSLRASSLGPRISLVILSCNRLLFTYGLVLRILCFYSVITGFFFKQKQLKVSYEIFLSSRSFGFHIPTSLEGGGGGGGYHFCVHFTVIFTSQERQCTDVIILSLEGRKNEST